MYLLRIVIKRVMRTTARSRAWLGKTRISKLILGYFQLILVRKLSSLQETKGILCRT